MKTIRSIRGTDEFISDQLCLAERYYFNCEFDKSIAICSSILTNRPSDHNIKQQVWSLLAECHYYIGNYLTAMKYALYSRASSTIIDEIIIIGLAKQDKKELALKKLAKTNHDQHWKIKIIEKIIEDGLIEQERLQEKTITEINYESCNKCNKQLLQINKKKICLCDLRNKSS